jgi:hypothetical protein
MDCTHLAQDRTQWQAFTNTNKLVRFKVLTAASMKTVVFWVVVPCSLVEFYRCFRGLAASTIRTMMEATCSSETSVNFYHATRRNNPEDSHLHKLTFQFHKRQGETSLPHT